MDEDVRVTLVHAPQSAPAICEWIEPALREIAGQDPLGLQTITTDRILPALLPGVLALSVRARYLSIYPFLLRRYQRVNGRADNQGLDDFIRHREFELCIAANLCEKCNADNVIGNRLARPLAERRPSQYERQRSIRSELGGYGLYYRSPLEELGVVLRRGEAMIGETPNPIDVLAKAERPQTLADQYEEAISETRWYRDWMHGVDPIPAEVLEELGEVGCLCRLDEHLGERETIRDLLLSSPNTERAEPSEERRRAFALLLDLANDDPNVISFDASFRDGAIQAFLASPNSSDVAGEARARWAAVSMRECVQDPLSSVWLHFCEAGLKAQSFDGLTSAQLEGLIVKQLIGAGETAFGRRTVTCTFDQSSLVWKKQLLAATKDLGWEAVREAAAEAGNALTGLAAFVVLCSRVPAKADVASAWGDVAGVNGDHQPGLLNTAALVRRKLTGEPTVAALMRWVIDNFIVSVHESVAMSKLPNSTFRFFWEDRRLRFVDNGVWRFDVSGLRRFALVSLAYDLGWWDYVDSKSDDDAQPFVTDDGRAVISGVFNR
jgi:hypothetical protein